MLTETHNTNFLPCYIPTHKYGQLPEDPRYSDGLNPIDQTIPSTNQTF